MPMGLDPKELLLSPREKWSLHRVFPWQLLVHLLLLVVVTFQVVTYNQQDAVYTRSMNLNWYHYIYGDAITVTSDDTIDAGDLHATVFHDVEDLVQSMRFVLRNFDNIKNKSLTKFNYASVYEPDDPPIDSNHTTPSGDPEVEEHNVELEYLRFTEPYDKLYDPASSPTYDTAVERVLVNQVPPRVCPCVRECVHVRAFPLYLYLNIYSYTVIVLIVCHYKANETHSHFRANKHRET